MVEVEQLDYRFKSHEVIRQIDLAMRKGEICCILGPNGAGKTTLLKCMNGLLRPTRGTVKIEGKELDRYSRHELAKRMAYVPQAESVRFPITVYDTILLGRKPYMNWRPSSMDMQMVTSIMDRMELTDLAMRNMSQLSGGERQKVMIAKAIVQQPQILLLDEPSTYLDLKFQLKMMQWIREIVDEQQLCAVLTTHDLNLALRYADQIAVLHSGRIAASGTPDMLTEEVIHHVYEVRAHIRQEEGKPFVVPLHAM